MIYGITISACLCSSAKTEPTRYLGTHDTQIVLVRAMGYRVKQFFRENPWSQSQLHTGVVVSLGILPYIEWLDTYCQGVQLSLLAFLVSS